MPTAQTIDLTVKKKRTKPAETEQPDFQAMVEETRAKMQGAAKTTKAQSKLKQAQASLTPAATPLAPGSLAAQGDLRALVPTLEIRQCVAVTTGDREVLGAIVGITGDVATVLQMPSGQIEVPLADCTPISLVLGAALREGDLVVLQTREGLWRVTGFDDLAGAHACERTDVPGETTFTPRSGARIVRRAHLASTCHDLGQAPTVAEQFTEAAPATDEDLPFPVTEAQLDAALPAEPTALPELPGTPVLLDPAEEPTAAATATGPILRGADVRNIALAALHPSPLNPRKVFDEAKIAELADSIFHQGLMQNLVIRPNKGEGGGYEVIAGGRRLRALQLLATQGRIDAARYMVPVRVQDLTDLDALMLAVAENGDRENPSPLEEADSYVAMIGLGATPEDIAVRYGRPLKFVHQRLVLAQGLDDKARDLLEHKKISIGQAQVVAQTTGPMREHVLERARIGDSPDHLRNMVKRGSFLVEHAKFNVEDAGLEVVEDLYGTNPARFADAKTALSLQLGWVNARAEKLRAKGKHHFVEVVTLDSPYLSPSHEIYDRYPYAKYKPLAGILIQVSTSTGEVAEHSGIVRKADIRLADKAEREKDAAAKGEKAEARPMPDSAFVEAHKIKAAALRNAVLGQGHLALVIAVHGLWDHGNLGSFRLRKTVEPQHIVPLPDMAAHMQQAVSLLGGLFEADGEGNLRALQNSTSVKLFDHLLTLSADDLAYLLSLKVAVTAYDWDEYYQLRAPMPLYDRLATHVNANAAIASTFTLTDEHLKRYPREQLVELAGDAGMDVDALGLVKTAKEIRTRILQKAEQLKGEGFIPRILRFLKR